MEQFTISIPVISVVPDELDERERLAVSTALECTSRSYSPYSRFSVGAALLLENGDVIPGCNQENAAFGVTMCAERSALFAAGARCPEVAPVMLAIAARDTEGQIVESPIAPCGVCRQALVETETRYGRRLPLLLVGRNNIYKVETASQLLPLTFTSYE